MQSRSVADRSIPGLAGRAMRFAATLAIGAVLSLATVAPFATPAEAAPKGGFGSRGSRTFQAPPATTTTPRTAAPIERTQAPRPAAQQPGATGAPAAGGFLSGGLGRGLVGGLIAGGLIGMLFGGGLGGLSGLLGLILQVALIGGAIWLVMRFIRSRQQPQPGYAGPSAHGAPAPGGEPMQRQGLGMPGGLGGRPMGAPAGLGPASGPLGGLAGLGGLTGGGAAPNQPLPTAEPVDELGLDGSDFEQFERILSEMQTAFARADYETLRDLTTVESFNELVGQREEMRQQGLESEIRDVKLLQGDLSESWREGPEEYATVAMRYEMIDVTREAATGRVVDGDPAHPTEATQVWTFYRQRDARGGPLPWVLSAMQDVA